MNSKNILKGNRWASFVEGTAKSIMLVDIMTFVMLFMQNVMVPSYLYAIAILLAVAMMVIQMILPKEYNFVFVEKKDHILFLFGEYNVRTFRKNSVSFTFEKKEIVIEDATGETLSIPCDRKLKKFFEDFSNRVFVNQVD